MTFRAAFGGVLVGALLVAAGACGSFGNADPAAPEGGADGEGADGGTTDTVDAGDAGGSSWIPCSARPSDPTRFCDDFDRAGPVELGWDLKMETSGVADHLDDGLSLPRSFRARLDSSAAPARAQLRHRVEPAPKSTYRLAFSVRIDELPHTPNTKNGFAHLVVGQMENTTCPSGEVSPRTFELTLDASRNVVSFSTTGLLGCQLDGGSARESRNDLPFAPSQLADKAFHHVVIDISSRACPNAPLSPFTARVAVDDVEHVCRPLFTDVPAVTTFFDTFLGAYVGGAPLDGASFVYDNVTIDAE